MKQKQITTSSPQIRSLNISEHYQIINKVGRGSYGTVYKAKGLIDNQFYAIKKLENTQTKLQHEGFPITALREICLLKQIDHPNIIKLKQIIVSRPNKRNLYRGSTFLVFQYVEHDFAGLFKANVKYAISEVKCIMRQLLEGVAYLHKNNILHRDIKSANILLSDDGEVKLADFGLGRKYKNQMFLTHKVVTLWYRAPQLILGCRSYSTSVDVWSLGCVFAQFLTNVILFKKQTDAAQMQRIFQICGDFKHNGISNEYVNKYFQYHNNFTPAQEHKNQIANYFKKMSPNISPLAIDLLEKLLHLDFNKRISCEQALKHPFFAQKPLACAKSQIRKQDYQCHEILNQNLKIDRSMKREQQNGRKQIEEKDYKERSYRDYQDQYRKPIRDYNKEEKDRYRHHYEKRKYDQSKASRSKSQRSNSSSSKSSSISSMKMSNSKDKSKQRSNRQVYSQARQNKDDFKYRPDYNRVDYRRKQFIDKQRQIQYKEDRRRDDRKYQRRIDARQDRRQYYREDRKQDRRQQRRDPKRQQKRYQNHEDHRDERYRDERRQYRKQDRRQFKRDERSMQRRQDRRYEYKRQQRRYENLPKRQDYRRQKDIRYQKQRNNKFQQKQPFVKIYDKQSKYFQKEGVYRYHQQKGDYRRRQQRDQQYNKEKHSQITKTKPEKYIFVRGKNDFIKKPRNSSSSSSPTNRYNTRRDNSKITKKLFQNKNHYRQSNSPSDDNRYH